MIIEMDVRFEPREVFAWTDADGTELRFDVTAIWESLLAREPVLQVFIGLPLDEDHVRFVLLHRGVVPEHVRELPPEVLPWPVLGVEMPDRTTLSVDGHHRLVARWLDGHRSYTLWRFPLGTWERFLV